MGMVTVVPAGAEAGAVLQQGTNGEADTDPDSSTPGFVPEGAIDLFGFEGSFTKDGRPVDWVGQGGNLMVPEQMMEDDPGPERDDGALLMARPPVGPDDGRIDRPMGAMMDPQRHHYIEPDTREFLLMPHADQQPGVDRAAPIGEASVERAVPYFAVDLHFNSIYGGNWTVGSTVDLTIDDPDIPGDVDYSTSMEVDEWGEVITPLPIYLKSGQIVTLSDGSTTKTHTIIDLAVTGFDEDANTISGTANPGLLIIDAWNESGGDEYLTPEADGDGLWTVTFASVIVEPGMVANIYQFDGDGDYTRTYWRMPNPGMNVYPYWDEIDSWGWPTNTPVTMTINDGQLSQTRNSYGDGYVTFWPNFDILAGTKVELSDGTFTRTHTVTSLTITQVDDALNSVSGTAEAFSEVIVEGEDEYEWEDVTIDADSSGNWSATFTVVNLSKGSYGTARQYDAEGNSTIIHWNVPDPYFSVYPGWDNVYGSGWSSNAPVQLSINNTWVATETASSWGYVDFYLDVDVVAGQTIKLFDGTYTREHTVTSLAVTDIDQDLNTVSGTAAAGSEVYIDGNNGYDWEDLFVSVVAGSWTANFTYLDIDTGSYGYARQYDDQGNSTNIYWYVPDPYMRVYPQWSEIQGYRWTPNTTITLTIGSNVWTEESDQDGWVDFWNLPIEILPGQEVVMTDDIYTRSHVVTNLTVTGFDEVEETVSGMAEAGSEVYVDGWNSNDWEDVTVSASGSGNWIATFSNLDIAPGTSGNARQFDPAGNSTNIYWSVPDPYFRVYPLGDFIYGSEWTPNTLVTASVQGSSIGSGWSDSTGYVYIRSSSYDIKFGDTVVLTDGTYTRTHVVYFLEVTSVNQTTNVVSGKAEANAILSHVSARGTDGNWAYRYPPVDGSGNWSANFSGDVNITKGVYGWVGQRDEARSSTHIYWYVPDPMMTIYPEEDQVYGYDWPANTTITLSIGTKTWMGTSSYDGSISFYSLSFDILTGQTVTMSGGGYSKAHTVRNLAVTTIDAVTDTVSGTSAGSAQIVVWACDYNCNQLTVTANSSGVWAANFTGLVDIDRGSSGAAAQYDPDGDSTVIFWYFRDPYFIVRPNGDYVYGYDWKSNSPVTLRIDGTLIATETSRAWGYVDFNLESFDIQPGQTVVVSDGTNTKTHIVIDLAVTGYDGTAKTLSGTADPGWLTIRANDQENSEQKDIEANESGEWTATLSTVVIEEGVQAQLSQSDADNDRTDVFWFIPDPTIGANPKEEIVYGSLWPAFTEVTLTIEASRESWTETSSEYGGVGFDLEEFDLLPGHELVMTDESGTYTQTHRVRNIRVTLIDLIADTVSGTAEPGSELVVCAETYTSQYYTRVCLDIVADEFTGAWLADFSGSLNISIETSGDVSQFDEGDNFTYIFWQVSIIAPQITGQAALSTPEETPLLIELSHLLVSDADSDYPDDFTLTVFPGDNYTLDGHTITPVLDFNGMLTVPVKVNDGTHDSNTFNLQVTVTPVNDPPVITESNPQSVTMSEDGVPNPFSLTLNATDVDGDTLTWSILTQASHGTAVVSGTGTSKVIGYTPEKDYFGSDSFIVQVSDGKGGSDTITVNVIIESVNDPPVVGNIPNQSINQGESFTTIALDDYVEDVDHSKDQITWSHSGNTDLIVSINEFRVATITVPDASWSGSETITFTATDSDDGSDSDFATFSVNAVGNNPPVISGDDPVAVTMSEDSDPIPFSLTLNATDADGDTLTWSISTPASHGTAVASGTGTSKEIGYTPDKDYYGPDSFVVQVIDGKGGIDTVTVNVIIEPVNDPPVITGHTNQLSTEEGTALEIQLSDLEVEDDNKFPDDFMLIVLPGTGYTVVGNAITPEKGFVGMLDVNVKVNDGEFDSNVYQLPVTVTEKVDEGFKIFLPLILR